MDFLINRTNILEALKNENPKIMEDLGDLGRLLVGLVGECGLNSSDYYITKLNNEVMFDDIFKKVIGNSPDFLMKCFTGEQGRGQHMCKENELIYAHITYDDFPEAYEGVEDEYLQDFGDNLLKNGFKEITDDLKHIRSMINFDLNHTRSFIYTVNKFGREFAPLFDQIIQYNMDLNYEEEQREAEERDMNPDHFADNPDVGYKYHVSYTYNKPHERGLQIATQVIRIGSGPINTVEAVEALREYVESTVEDAIQGSLTILAFSYMGIERYELPELQEPEEDYRVNPDEIQEIMNDDYYLDEEDGDHPAVEPVKKEEKKEGDGVKTYKLHYTTSLTDFKERQEVIVPVQPVVDLTKGTDEELQQIIHDYEGIPEDVEVSVSGIEEIKIAPGELPFVLKREGEDEVVKNED